MKKKFLEKLIIFSITVIVCFLLLEIGLRVTGHGSFNLSLGEYEQHGNSYRLQKNATKFHDWSTSTFTVCTNSLGIRDKNVGERDIGDRPYIVFIGDSQVFGLGVDYEKSFVGVFADYAAEKDIEVLNLATGGHFLQEQEELFKEILEKMPNKPSLLFYTVNASSLNWFDSVHKGILVKNGYVFYRATWKSAYVKMMLQNNLSFYVFFRDIYWSLNRSWGGTENEVRFPKHFDLYTKESRLYDAETVRKLEDHINRFQSYCDELGIRTVYLYLPIVDSFTIREIVTQLGRDPDEYDTSIYQRFMVDYCARHEHLYLDPKPVLKEYYDQGEELDLGRDPHYNDFSNRIVGEYIIEQVFVENELF